jgi:nitrate reductase beta subunit
MLLGKIFANPHLPGIDDYYEPFDYDYQNLHNAPESKHQPIARPRSLITGQRMDKITSGPNWEEILGGEFEKRAKDQNFENMQKAMYGQFENTFMMYLPRLCEHCLNPACVATCPSGAIYKREEDGIVLIDQDKCRGWRMCITGCPYKKIYFNWKSGKSRSASSATRVSNPDADRLLGNLRGRIRYLGVLLYDADAIENAASTENEKDLYQRQLDVFLNPNDPKVIEQALKDGVPQALSTPPSSRRCTKWRWTGSWRCRCIRNIAPCRWSGTCRRCRRFSRPPTRGTGQQRYSAGRGKPAYPGSVSGQPADRGRYPAGAAGAETHAGDAPLQTRGNRRRRTGYPGAGRGRPHRSAGAGDVSLSGDR